jgi:hypothetical protein
MAVKCACFETPTSFLESHVFTPGRPSPPREVLDGTWPNHALGAHMAICTPRHSLPEPRRMHGCIPFRKFPRPPYPFPSFPKLTAAAPAQPPPSEFSSLREARRWRTNVPWASRQGMHPLPPQSTQVANRLTDGRITHRRLLAISSSDWSKGDWRPE